MDGLNEDSGPGLILVKTALDKLRDEELLKVARTGKATAEDPIVFTQDTANNAAKVVSVIGGGGYFNKTIDDRSTSSDAAIQAATPVTVLIATFKKNLPIPWTFMDDQQESAVAKAVRQQTMTWASSRDRNAFYVYGNGFTTSVTVDGVALFSNSHVSLNGDTVDNLETGLPTDANMNILVNSLRQQIAQTGTKTGYEPDFALFPSITHQTGMTIAKSVLRAGTGNNDLNYWSEMYPGMKVVYNPFLDDISTTAWFVGSGNHGVERYMRKAFFSRLVNWETDEEDCYLYKMRAREEVAAIEYSGLVGSNGTTS